MKIREAWRFAVNGEFLGSFLRVGPNMLFLEFEDPESRTTLAGVSFDGVCVWEKRWKGFAYFDYRAEQLFVDGDKARLIDPKTGDALAERSLGGVVETVQALDAGPVYRMAEEDRYVGLDRGSLEPLWEWAADDVSFEEHRMCRYDPKYGIVVRELPSCREIHTARVTPVSGFGAHSHAGDLYCIFGYTRGGRAAVDLSASQVAWSFDRPTFYGLTTFDSERAYSPVEGLSAWDLRTGQLLWKRVFGEIPTSPARPDRGLVYVATGDRYLHVVEAKTGEPLASHELDFKITGTIEPAPVVPWSGGRVVVGTRREIFCLEVE